MTKLVWRKFIAEESGQTTTEYILILAVVVTMILQFKTRFTGILRRLFDGLDSKTGDDIFEEG